MKKIVLFLICSCMLVTLLTACKNKADSPITTSTTEESALPTEEPTSEVTAEPTPSVSEPTERSDTPTETASTVQPITPSNAPTSKPSAPPTSKPTDPPKPASSTPAATDPSATAPPTVSTPPSNQTGFLSEDIYGEIGAYAASLGYRFDHYNGPDSKQITCTPIAEEKKDQFVSFALFDGYDYWQYKVFANAGGTIAEKGKVYSMSEMKEVLSRNAP